MGPIDFVVIGVVFLIVALALFYVIRAKKRGAKCIGCPSSGTCGSGNGTHKAGGSSGSSCTSCSSCGGACGCGAEKSSEKEKDTEA